MSPRFKQLIALSTFALLLVCFESSVTNKQASAQQPKQQSTSLTQIPGGTAAVPSTTQPTRWNQLVLSAKPVISSGDINSLSTSIRSAATTLSLTIMASVTKNPADGSFVLREVGVGYSLPIAGKPTIITSATQSNLGANLGFIQRRMLSTNESQVAKISVVVHTSTLLIFDVPSIMHRVGKHGDYVTRHLIWIDAKTGAGAMMAWLMTAGPGGSLKPANEPLRLVAFNTQEQRRIHVDGNEFTFGIPSERAFALEDLPPGKKVTWTQRVANVATLPKYSAAQLVELSGAINQALNPAPAK